MARTTSQNYRLTVLARAGKLTVVDFAHHPEGRPVGSARLTRLDPALVGKAVLVHAVPRPAFTMDFRTYVVRRQDDLLTEAAGAPNWGNLLRTGAELFVSSDGYETRFWCKAPSKPRVWDDPTDTIILATRLSHRIPLPDTEEYPRVGEGDPLLIAPWRDPEMLGHAVLAVFRLCRPPFGNDVKESVLEPPDGKRRTALHRAALAGDLEELPPAGRRTAGSSTSRTPRG